MITKTELQDKSLQELIELKNCVNEIVLRTHIQGLPSPKWMEYNNLLMLINDTIEDVIYKTYIQ